LLCYSPTPQRTADELKVKSKQYIENLEWQDIKTLLRYSSNPQQIINLLLLNKLFVVRLNLKGVEYLLRYSENPKPTHNIITRLRADLISN